MIKRTDTEEHERQSLASYAAHSAESKGRVFPQPEHPLRTAFQRDRDRIIHSAAFRRMEYKTQVFLPHEADHFRTRLTHTIEVAQVARSLARNLRLNEDLTEAIALVHDLGHTPFGHSGEDVLDELLVEFGGFNHNRQSLRIVDFLEQRYLEHPGLNLSYEVREGIAKHETKVKISLPEFNNSIWPTLEASLVDQADSLAYSAHDIDDGVNSGLITLEDIRHLSIWSLPDDAPGQPALFDRLATHSDDQIRRELVRFLIDRTATDLLQETESRLESQNITSLDMLRSSGERVCAYSEDMAVRFRELREFLFAQLYRHPRLMHHATSAREVIETLYEHFTVNPEKMPDRFVKMLDNEINQIVVADYIAGMTDRYAENLFMELT